MDQGSGVQVAVFFKTVAWPVLAAFHVLIFAAIVGRLVRRDLAPRATGLAFAAGVVAALIGARGAPHWPPADTLDWLGPLVALAAVAGIGADAAPGRWRGVVHLAPAPALALLASRLLLVPPGADPSFAWLGAAGMLCVLWVATATSRAAPAPGWHGAWAGAAVGAAAVLALSGSALLAQVLGAIAVLAGGLALLGFRRNLARVPTGAVGPLVLAYGGVLAYAWAFTEAPRGALILALLAPASTLIGLTTRRPWLALLVATLVAAAVAGTWAAFLSPATPEPYPPP